MITEADHKSLLAWVFTKEAPQGESVLYNPEKFQAALDEIVQRELSGLRAQIELLREAKLELDEFEGVIDEQTYDEHRKFEFDMPGDAELHIVLTAKDERRLGKALTQMTRALMAR
jgi:prefoldin subunit 5